MLRTKAKFCRYFCLQGIQPPVLVFVQSKERAQELFNELIYDGMNVDAIHSGKTQAQVIFFSSLSQIDPVPFVMHIIFIYIKNVDFIEIFFHE